MQSKSLPGMKACKRVLGFQVHCNGDQRTYKSDIGYYSGCFTGNGIRHTLNSNAIMRQNTIDLAF